MKVNVPIWSKVILGYTETFTGLCRGGLPAYEKCRPLIAYEENCRLKWSTMAINTFNISRGRKFPLQVLFTANLSFPIFQLTEGFGV